MRLLLPFSILLLGLPLLAASDALDLVVTPPELPTKKSSLPCLQCNGKGTITYLFMKGEKMLLTTSDSTKIKDNLLHRKCSKCNGLRSVIRTPTPLEMLTLTKKTFTTYRQEQLSNGMLPIGEAFVPKDVYISLSVEDKADIARRYPPYCKKCLGLGFIPCRHCEGQGKQIDPRNKEKSILVENVLITCKQCDGKGKHICKTCDGNGVPKICKRCQGVGYFSKVKKGEPTSELCKSCNGSGHH